jgi:hypothetical protein
VLTAPAGTEPPPGSFGFWLTALPVDASFIRHFVLITSWVGALLGLVLLSRRGTRWSDPFTGLVAGAAAGVMGSATFACLMPLLDTLPRLFWHGLNPLVGQASVRSAAWLWTPLWVIVAVAAWTLQGAAAGLLLRLPGQRGLRLLAGLGRPFASLSSLFKVCGLGRAAAFFALQ